MKILKEAKDQLPSSFVTDKISKLWEEIGYIKEEQKAIKQTFSGTDKVIEILRELEDSYLIAVSRLQAFASNKNIVVLPEADGKAAIKEALEEDAPAADILQDFAAKLDQDDAIDTPAATPAAKPTVAAVSDTDLDAETDRLLADDTEPSVSAAPAKENSNKDNFEYFCDFDDPEPDDEADADLQDARAQLA